MRDTLWDYSNERKAELVIIDPYADPELARLSKKFWALCYSNNPMVYVPWKIALAELQAYKINRAKVDAIIEWCANN